jgi:hypothetical protein
MAARRFGILFLNLNLNPGTFWGLYVLDNCVVSVTGLEEMLGGHEGFEYPNSRRTHTTQT